jgi:hypothetical protein
MVCCHYTKARVLEGQPGLTDQEKETYMYAVVVKVTLHDPDAARAELHDKVIPRVSQAPGFVAGYWTDKDNKGMSMLVFESEDAATGASKMIPATVPDSVTLEDVEVREVVGHA